MNATTGYDSYYDAQYNNRARVPGHPAILAAWERDAAAYREAAGDRRTLVRYGDGERHFIDLFGPEGTGAEAATVVFVHGGYWQNMHPSFVSHLARGLNVHGITVAIPGYDLCPQVRVGDIVEQVRLACRALAGRGPLIASGHSAGGHLAACLLATDWTARGLPRDFVPAAYSISGLFDLEPLVRTHLNVALRLDDSEARSLSPIHWTPPAGTLFDAVVGAEESGEYLRQSAAIAERWAGAGVATRFEAIPGANHFTVLAPLAEPDSAMTGRIARLARGER
jgi:arylformamidase